MRVLAIRGRNLASLEGDFEVDFTSEPLESAGIFAITGPTGAGKSTLLDAMCLALFNRLPRLTAASGGQVGAEGGESISATDVRAVLRHRAGEGFAEVDFLGRDRARYRARWTLRRAREKADGALQNVVQELTNLDTGERIGGTRTETLEAIRDRVGLTADQFARAVMLAQGEFDAFVRADANDRATLLEKLTGTEVYGRLGVAAKHRADAFRAELVLLEQRISDQRGLDDVARAEAEARLASARELFAVAQEELANLERQRQWYAMAAELAERVTAAQATLDQARLAQTNANARRETLRRRREAWAVVGFWKSAEEASTKAATGAAQLAKIEAEVTQKQDEVVRLAAAEQAVNDAWRQADAARVAAQPDLEKARQLDRELVTVGGELTPLEDGRFARAQELDGAEGDWGVAERRLREAEAALSALDQWMAMNDSRRALALRDEILVQDLAEYAELADQTRRLTTEASLVANDAGAKTKELIAAEEAATAAASLYAASQAHLEKVRAAAPSPNELETATNIRNALASVDAKLATVEHQNARVAQLESDAARFEAEHVQVSETMVRDGSEADQIAVALPQLRARLDEARRSSALSSAAADETAARLRATLLHNEPCPVCGSREHEVDAVASLIDQRAEADLARVNELDLQVSNQAQRAAVLADRGTACAERIANLESNKQRVSALIGSACAERSTSENALKEAAAAANLDLVPDIVEVREILSERLVRADASRALLESARRSVEEARIEADSQRAKSDEAQRLRLAATEAEREVTLRHADLTRQLNETHQKHDRLAAELDAELAPHFDWKHARDPKAELDRLVSEWKTRDAEQAAAVSKLPELRQAVHSADLGRTAARGQLEQVEQSLAALRERRERLSERRAALFEGEATAAVTSRLDGAVQSLAVSQDAARNAAADARTALAAAEGTVHSRRQTQALDVADAARRSSELASRLAPLGLTTEEVASEAEAGADALAAEEEALQLIDMAVTRSEAEFAARSDDHARHLSTDAPMLEAEALAKALQTAEAEQARSREIESEAALVIRQDDTARAATAAMREEHADKSARAQVWLRLDTLIGDATGNKFRRFAQGLTLDRLLAHANARLSELKPRYELQRGTGGDMLVQVIDHDMAGEVRGLHNLSGGERFLVSLALALGLSEMSTGQGFTIESLFIDEGFGSLDSASLGAAIAMLEQLHATGRRVGVISHIEEVKERIPVKIAVTPVARGRSKVEVLTG